MSTFLQLVQDLHRESGAGGAQPTTVVGAAGEAKRLVNWIVRADLHIKNLYVNWKFLRALHSVATVNGTATQAKPATLNYWDFDTFRIVEAGTTEPVPIEAVEYEEVKTEVLDTNPGVPSRIIVMPDNSLLFEPVPNGIHTIKADFHIVPAPLASDAQVSVIPEAFHMAILGHALISYGNFENAADAKTQGQEILDDYLPRLENHSLPYNKNSRFRTGGFFEVIGSQ